MKMKSILLMVLALCLAVCLCACGSDTDSDKKDSKTSPTVTTTTQEEITTTTTEAGESAPTESTTTTSAAPVVTEPTQPVDGKANYTVIVTDEAGNPVPGAFVQLCLESCIPCITNAQGVATYSGMDVADYKVSFISVPDGYEKPADNYYFEKDSYEMTLVLKAAN